MFLKMVFTVFVSATLYAQSAVSQKSLPVLKKECAEGNATSCNNAGVLSYDQGQIEKASDLYRRSCDLKLGVGCSNAGCLVNPNSSCKKLKSVSLAKAQDFYEDGCLLKSGASCYNFGLSKKKAGETDRATMAFALGCSFGDLDACKESGGKRVSDIPEVIERIEKSSKAK